MGSPQVFRTSPEGSEHAGIVLGVSENDWFIMENPIKKWIARGTPISGNLHMGTNARNLREISPWWNAHDDIMVS